MSGNGERPWPCSTDQLKQVLQAMPVELRSLVLRLLLEIESEARSTESPGVSSTEPPADPMQAAPSSSASGGSIPDPPAVPPGDGRLRRPGYRCGVPCEQCFEGTCNRGKPFHSHHNCLRCHKGEDRA